MNADGSKLSERSWKVKNHLFLIYTLVLAIVLLSGTVSAQNINFWFAQQGNPSGASIDSIDVEVGSPFTVSLWYQTSDAWLHNAVELMVGFDRTMLEGSDAIPLDGKITYVGASNMSFPIILANTVGGGYGAAGERPYGAHLAVGAALGTNVTASMPVRIADLTLKNTSIPVGGYYDVVIWDAGSGSRWTTFATRRDDIRRDAQMAVLRVNSISGSVTDYTIPQWKALGDGERGRLVEAEVTVDVGADFYVGEVNRSAGIRVAKVDTGVALAPGSRVTIVGSIETNANGERYIDASNIDIQAGSATIEPLGLAARALGGGNWQYDSSTGAGQRGVKNGNGVNNVGLLVHVWGVPVLTSSSDSFMIDDGSGASVKVQLPSGQTHSWNSGNVPAFVSVKGASGLVKNADNSYTSVIYIGSFSTDVVTVVQ